MRAAEALRASAEDYPDVSTLHLDVMDFVPDSFRKLYADSYIKMVNAHPALWGMLYKRSSNIKPTALVQKIRRTTERLSTRDLLKAIKEFQPDAIVCTHFLPAEILMHEIRRQRLHVPVWVQVTDFDLHRMWVIPLMTGYFAANDEIAYRMRANGLPAEQIHVTGIPIMPAFSQPLSRETCAAQFGLDPSRQTFVLMGGGAGVGGLESVAEALLAAGDDFQLIVLAGKNAKALATLKTLAEKYPTRLFPQGFTKEVERLMACADAVITKPGGLTTSECLAMGLPMIVNAPIPGQEEHNADYLLEEGAALKAIDETGLVYRVRHLVRQPEQLATMARRAKALGRPHAARAVLDVVLADLAAR
ncbi:Monogalactosyldiacylglycerol synthase [Dyella jiangningensis]|nr:monogalactosyldiacylglycerol synthase [Dyella sp. AtDHG13]SDK43606.1 Monogalactosyldiacylglycerol synthase [Dyella jiangningensis]